eukprot:3742990-Amphidinium_carterae.1
MLQATQVSHHIIQRAKFFAAAKSCISLFGVRIPLEDETQMVLIICTAGIYLRAHLRTCLLLVERKELSMFSCKSIRPVIRNGIECLTFTQTAASFPPNPPV